MTDTNDLDYPLTCLANTSYAFVFSFEDPALRQQCTDAEPKNLWEVIPILRDVLFGCQGAMRSNGSASAVQKYSTYLDPQLLYTALKNVEDSRLTRPDLIYSTGYGGSGAGGTACRVTEKVGDAGDIPIALEDTLIVDEIASVDTSRNLKHSLADLAKTDLITSASDDGGETSNTKNNNELLSSGKECATGIFTLNEASIPGPTEIRPHWQDALSSPCILRETNGASEYFILETQPQVYPTPFSPPIIHCPIPRRPIPEIQPTPIIEESTANILLSSMSSADFWRTIDAEGPGKWRV